MRCYCCNNLLTDYEATIKSVNTNNFLDMCLNCLKTVKDDILYKDRIDLLSSSDIDDLDIYLEDINFNDYN
jgi:hypothetical protein